MSTSILVKDTRLLCHLELCQTALHLPETKQFHTSILNFNGNVYNISPDSH